MWTTIRQTGTPQFDNDIVHKAIAVRKLLLVISVDPPAYNYYFWPFFLYILAAEGGTTQHELDEASEIFPADKKWHS